MQKVRVTFLPALATVLLNLDSFFSSDRLSLILPVSASVIFDLKFDCDPIVSPEQDSRRKRGFADLAFRFADEVDHIVEGNKPSKWFFENISFVQVDVSGRFSFILV